ncbi:MAG: nitroreductase family deazaflavin-dependent oxidoreductase [Caldilineaceae bacterium]|nr:nitroreductase family deazaflavin-dependent oxidoreductase [Caldilineaceae bacterium]
MSLQEEPFDSPTDWVREHIRGYIATDGKEGHIWKGVTTLLLTTIGRRSGKPRRTALIYGRDGDRYIIVASKGGAEEHPNWYRNLTDHPEVEVQVLDDRFHARARTATAEERPRLWDLMAEIWPAYNDYQKKTSRTIPVVILERSDSAG